MRNIFVFVDMNETAVLVLCAEFKKSLFTYCDRKSQVLVHRLIKTLLKNYESVCTQTLVESVRAFAHFQAKNVATLVQSVTVVMFAPHLANDFAKKNNNIYSFVKRSKISHSSIAALEWTRIIIKQFSPTMQTHQIDSLKELIVSQALLLASITQVSSPK